MVCAVLWDRGAAAPGFPATAACLPSPRPPPSIYPLLTASRLEVGSWGAEVGGWGCFQLIGSS